MPVLYALRVALLYLVVAAARCGSALGVERAAAGPHPLSSSGEGAGEVATAPGSPSSPPSESSSAADRLIRWITSNGGSVDPRQEVREDGKLRGVYAAEFIPRGAVLLSLPPELVLTPDPDKDDRGDQCGTISALRREMELGSDSTFAPYILDLIDYVDGGGLSGLMDTWSPAGVSLLDEVLGRYLPPRERHYNVNMWRKFCGGNAGIDPLGMRAALLMASRAAPAGVPPREGQRGPSNAMIPFFDLYNHRNSPSSNVEKVLLPRETSSSSPPSGSGGVIFEMHALRDISAGEQIYYDYFSTTSDILRDYGFVEQYPQKWAIPTPDGRRVRYVLTFELDEEDGSAKVTSKGVVPTPAIMFLRDELRRLGHVKKQRGGEGVEEGRGASAAGMPEPIEERLVWEYHRAITRAIKSVLEELDKQGKGQPSQGATGRSRTGGGEEL